MNRERIQQLINAGITIAIIIISLLGYKVTVLDPAKVIIIENGRFIAGQVQELNARLETIADMALALQEKEQEPFLAGGTTHFSALGVSGHITITGVTTNTEFTIGP